MMLTTMSGVFAGISGVNIPMCVPIAASDCNAEDPRCGEPAEEVAILCREGRGEAVAEREDQRAGARLLRGRLWPCCNRERPTGVVDRGFGSPSCKSEVKIAKLQQVILPHLQHGIFAI